MTLMGAILQTISINSIKTQKSSGGYTYTQNSQPRSPPPEVDVIDKFIVKKKKCRPKKSCYDGVSAKVDTRPPRYHARFMFRKAPDWIGKRERLAAVNLDIFTWIKDAQMTGRVDHRWKHPLRPCVWAYENRVNAAKWINRDNIQIYQRLVTQGPKVASTESLMRDWSRNRADIIHRALGKFVLFPTVPMEHIEDAAFVTPPGVKRPRVYFTLHMEGFSAVGELCAELFTDVCPRTCGLFMELLAGDGVGYSYVNTHFFRKVPELYWAGGDVARDNGFGCYAQRGRCVPIGAENYHFAHSMPGLLSMAVTKDDEMCGIFYITFKPLPQFDLKNVVFGRIIRPSLTFEAIRHIGEPLSTRPLVTLSASRQLTHGQWLQGMPNTKLQHLNEHMHLKQLSDECKRLDALIRQH